MSLQEIKTDYLTHWLNQLIESGIINREHLIYQNIEAFLTEQLSQPNPPVTNWEQWPILYSYCCSDGPASKAQLSEPTGLCFDFDSAIICCFGGSKNGYIKLYSAVDFACRFMAAIRQIYHAIGFLPKKEQNYLAKVGKNPAAPFVEGTDQLAASLTYLESLIVERKKYLKAAPSGPEGTVYHVSVQGLAETVKSLQGHIQSFKQLGMQDILAHLSLYAFVNEARKEHRFAKHKQKGQCRHPTLQQYVHSKGSHEIEQIKKICNCSHDYHTNNYSAYQPTHQSSLSSVKTIAQYRKWSEKFHPQPKVVEQEQAKEDLKVARMLNVLTKSKPTQNIRELYRYKCGYGPCVIIQKDTLSEGGDIVAINPGTENEVPSGDKWWLLQVNKPHHLSKNRSGCHVFGFWLAEKDTIDMSVSGKHYSLLPQSVKTYFGTIIKDNNNVPLVIPVEELNSGWQNGQVVYAFTEEYCRTLDLISHSFRKGLHAADNNEEDGASDLEADEDDRQPPDIHEVELMAMQRRRVVCGVEGQIFSSYRDLLNPRQAGGRRQRRIENLGNASTESEAERNN
ncbi:Hypothetical predicted protein [Paramuricea clavata]|uniref:Uncharacterized protein n=1 Tax=Paramuricea clavata TaxID=317549 RepID=A0A7D9HB19_PARCT|nr:Hypothetical predicted protein [Paramuricea clavata]